MIKLISCSKTYKNGQEKNCVIENLNLELPNNGLVIICGESGSGKTTLLNCISGIDKFDNGEITGISKSDVAFVFQDFQLLDQLSVLKNLEFVQNKPDLEKIKNVLKIVGIENKINSKVNELSGGQKQRVAIARALLLERPYLFCDEPTGNLDSENSKLIAELLKKISKDKLVIVITHNKELFSDLADRFITLKDGTIISDTEKIKHEDIEIVSKDREKISFKKIFSLYKIINKKNNKVFLNFILSFILILLVFAGFNVLTNDYSKTLMENVNRSNLTVVTFRKSEYGVKNYSYSKFDDKELNNLNLKNYFYCYDRLSSPHTMKSKSGYTDNFKKSINTVYVSEFYYQNNKYIDIKDDEIVLSYECAAEYFNIYYGYYASSLNELNQIIGMDFYNNNDDINLKIIAFDKKMKKIDSLSDSYEDATMYIYVNNNTYINNIMPKYFDANNFFSVTYIIGDDSYFERDTYGYSCDAEIGNIPSDDNEVMLSYRLAYFLGITDNYESYVGSKIILPVNNGYETTDIINLEFIISGFSESTRFTENVRKELITYSFDYMNNEIYGRSLSFFADDISTGTITKLSKNSFNLYNYFSDDLYNVMGFAKTGYTFLILLLTIPVLVVYVIMQFSFVKNEIVNKKRIIGILKSLSYENKDIIKILLINSFGIIFICFLLTLIFGKYLIQLINIILKGISYGLYSFSYNPFCILALVISVVLFTLLVTFITYKKFNKYSDVDLIYERV